MEERTQEVRLRHHHLLCTMTFSGHGYDRGFVANMEEVVARLRSPDGQWVRLEASCDALCAACPNAAEGVCRDHRSVLRKDRSAALFLGLPERAVLEAAPLIRSVEERMRSLTDIRQVCGDCQWAELCNEWLRGRRSLEG